jgi:RNA polymerase sigma factor (sigma-70 family)
MSDTVSIMRNTPFPLTAWTMIEAARGEDATAREALNGLCNAYWAPVFGYISKRIRDQHQAMDIAQDFFVGVIKTGTLVDKADRNRGKFRTFLSQRLQWFLMDQYKKFSKESKNAGELKDAVQKDVASFLPILMPGTILPDPIEDPEFNLAWAKRTLENALNQLEDGYRTEGKEKRRQILAKTRAGVSRSEIAADLNLDSDTMKNELKAIRKESEAMVQAMVRATVSDDSFLNEEFKMIKQLLSSASR